MNKFFMRKEAATLKKLTDLFDADSGKSIYKNLLEDSAAARELASFRRLNGLKNAPRKPVNALADMLYPNGLSLKTPYSDFDPNQAADILRYYRKHGVPSFSERIAEQVTQAATAAKANSFPIKRVPSTISLEDFY